MQRNVDVSSPECRVKSFNITANYPFENMTVYVF
jgi:hypothetical protein